MYTSDNRRYLIVEGLITQKKPMTRIIGGVLRYVHLSDDRKGLIYILANIYERQGKPDDAAAQYKSIYEVDIRYRDVAEKVESGY